MFCLVTNRKSLIHGDLIDFICSVKQAEVQRIILREKDLSSVELRDMAMKIKNLLKDSKTELIVNSCIETAITINSHGVHFPFSVFKNTKKRHGITGVSVHNLEEAIYAYEHGADYLIAGHIYRTSCKEGLEPRGVQFLKEICLSVDIPVIGIGGIKPSNIPTIIKAGAKGIAVMSSVNSAINPSQKIIEYQAGLKIFSK